MQTPGTIYIIGAGAIGKALAVFLKLSNKNIILVRGSVDDGSSYFEKIEVELGDANFVTAEIEVRTISSISSFNGLVVFANKSFGNQELAKAVKTKIGGSPVVLLQNGLNIEQPFIDNSFARVYRCVLFATCQQLGPGKLRFKPVADSPVGVIAGNSNTLGRIVEQLGNHYFEFREEEHIQTLIWTKAIINSVFNSVCPLLETDNGIFYRDEQALQIAGRVIKEGIAVAAGAGVALLTGDVEAALLLISRSSEGQLISTLQDIRNKRQTEIESLNFAIVDVANTLKLQDIVSCTRLLGELVKIKSRLTSGQ
jgi:2-dehydropantoate 2-reductase